MQQAQDYVAHHYHQPSDEWKADWDMRGPLEDVEAFYLVGDTLANSDAWPGWKQGSEFKAAYDKMKAAKK